jgi:hypothetical protein
MLQELYTLSAEEADAWFQRRDALDSTATSDERQDNGPVPVTL